MLKNAQLKKCSYFVKSPVLLYYGKHLTTIDSGHINLENLLKLTIRKSVNKTGIFREKSDKKNGSLYTKSQHESCFLASGFYTALWSLLQIGGWYIMIVVYDDDFTEVSPCKM